MAYMNQGNWGSFLQAVPRGVETEQDIQGKDYANQQARDVTEAANRVEGQEQEQHNQNVGATNVARANNNADPNNQQQPYASYAQQTGGVFDPARNAIHNALANIGQFYQKVFHPQQGQTNPAAAPSGRGPGPAAQQTLPGPGQTGAQAPAAMSRPQAGSSGPAAPGTPGATGPMSAPEVDQTGGRFAEGGAIPGRKLRGIRAKKAKPGNEAKATAGDKAVANQQPGAGGPQLPIQAQGGPARNTEPGAGISNQDPQLADGGEPKKNWIAGAVKKPGALHRDLGVPEGEKIPKEKIKAAEKGGGKVAKRAQLADTMSKWKDGGMPKLPKLEPGAAPEPKPAPNAVEQTVNNDGMRHYLGKTIKRYADAGEVKHEPNAEVPTPAGMQPMGDPNQPSAFDRIVQGVKNFAAQPGEQSLAERYGFGGTNPAPPGLAGPSVQPAPEPSPGKGQSPAQQNAAPGAPRAATGQPNYTPAAPGGVPDENLPAVRQVVSPYDANIKGPQLPEDMDRAGQNGRAVARAAAEAGAGGGGGGQPTPQQGPANPNTAPVDFSKVQADQSQVPTMSTQDWNQMKQGISLMATAHGKSQGEANMMADEEVSGYQHKNFMQYLTQAQALDAAGNKQAAMTALKTAYQFFPTGHDMHFGLAPNGDILGYGVNEKTGEPVQNGLVHLNAQNLAGIISHFGDPKAFVDEGLRMQKQADETEQLHKATIPLARARGEYLSSVVPGRLATQELKNEGAIQKLQFASPDHEARFQAEFKDAPNHGDMLQAAAQLERLYTQHLGHPPDEIARQQIAGEVRTKYDETITSPQERATWQQQRGIQIAPQGQYPTPAQGREDYARTSNALSGG